MHDKNNSQLVKRLVICEMIVSLALTVMIVVESGLIHFPGTEQTENTVEVAESAPEDPKDEESEEAQADESDYTIEYVSPQDVDEFANVDPVSDNSGMEEAEIEAAADEELQVEEAEETNEAELQIEEEAVAVETEQQTKSKYILPESDSRYYSREELDALDDETLQMAINEIYARRGRKFILPAVRQYFEKQDWYKGTIAPEAFDGNEKKYFNQYEEANRLLMAEIRASREKAKAGNKNPGRN